MNDIKGKKTSLTFYWNKKYVSQTAFIIPMASGMSPAIHLL